MNNIFSKLSIKVSGAIGVSIFLVAIAVIGLAPRQATISRADGCSPVYTSPVFNPYPVTWEDSAGYNCTDFAVLSGNVQGAGFWTDNFQAQPGDSISMRIYVHNGAGSNSGAVMYGVNVNTNIDTTTGTSHVITTTLSASNAASKSGSVTINTPAGSHLELVSGDTSFAVGDMQPCFEYSKAFRFTLKVVADTVVTPPPAETVSGQISSSLGICKANGLYDANVSWNTNASQALVTVSDPNLNSGNYYDNDKVYSYSKTSNETASWLAPNTAYRFTLWSIDPSGTDHSFRDLSNNIVNVKAVRLYETWVTAGASCSQVTPPPANVTGTISTSLGICKANGLYNANVSWNTNATQGLVTVSDPNLKSGDYYDNDKIYSTAETSNETADWLAPLTAYRFTLWSIDPNGVSHTFRDMSNNVVTYKVTRLQESWVTAGASCDQVTPPPANITGTINSSLGICKANGLYNANVSWNTNATQPLVTVSNPPANSNNNYDNDKFYSTTKTGNETADWLTPNTAYRFTLWAIDPNGVNHTFRDLNNNVVTYKVTRLQETWVTAGNTCIDNPPTYENVVCSVSPSNLNVGQSATFTADKGNGTYAWSVTGGSVTSSNQKTFISTFNNAGAYIATVSSNGKTASCTVQVVNDNVCVANTNYYLNATAPAKQGTGYTVKLSWGFDGNHQIKLTQVSSDGSELTLATSPDKTGSLNVFNLQAGKTYTFKMYDIDPTCGKFLTSTQVVVQSNPDQLVCTSDSSSYRVGDTAVFRANGGSGSYSWSGTGNPVSGTGSVFNTSYNTAGNKTVTVTSADGQTAQCSTVVNTVVTENGQVRLTKEVRNITNSETAFAHATSAKQNDTVEYRIKVWAGTSVTLTNVIVNDSFASGLSYIDNSLFVDGTSHAAGLTSGGLTFTSVGQTPLVIIYRAKVTATMGTIVNTAQAVASNATNTAVDQALVNVAYVNPGQPSLSIIKQVKNVTQNTNYDTSVLANKNDVVKYQVIIKNVGQATAKNVFFNDSNPAQVQPLTGLTVSIAYTGGIPAGVALGDLAAGATVTITYQGTVKVDSGTILNVATASSDNATSQNASATVVVNTQNNNGGNSNYNYCVNYSCNTTINNTTNTTNTTTTNNNYTYNNYSYVYINSTGNTVPANQYSQLSITKSVRTVNNGTYQNSVNVNNGDTVEFEIVVTNSGNQNINNVRLTDNLPSGLNLVNGSVRVDGSYVSSSNLYSGMYLGSLSTGQQKRINFQATVNNSNSSIQNIAMVSGDNASSVQDDAWVFTNTGSVQGGNVSLTYSKRAINETKSQDATSVVASKEDYITYTLTASNNGNTPANNFIITDDLSQVLPYADIVDNGGGSVNGNVISFPGLTVPAYGSVSRSFKVRVKYSLADNLAYVMTNTYGNTLNIRINNPQVLGAFVAPKTGAETGAFAFSGLLTAAAALFKRRKEILKLIFT
ncbi:MAG: DUF11 domain-containing protein [Candidatus Doudnabacteria bacterium]|nr:DUF11 domain-containing protein [Candidatus Doudnabacteria bacterium]